MKVLLASFIFLAFLFSADARAAGSLSGRLLKSDGKPRAFTEIELIPVNSIEKVIDKRLWAISGNAGNFTFTGVPPGEYNLSINFGEDPSELSPYATFFYPNTISRAEAQTFKVDENTRATGITFKLPPPLRTRKMTIKVTDLDGKPAKNLMIAVKDLDSVDKGLKFYPYQPDAPGSYHFNGFETRKYQIFVLMLDAKLEPYHSSSRTANVIAKAKSSIFALDAQTSSVNLQLEVIKELDMIPDFNVGAVLRQSVNQFNPKS